MQAPIASHPAKAELYYSELARDLDLRELVTYFVSELPARLTAIERAAGDGDWLELGRLAHQLKGAGGSYGFPALAAAAASIEKAIRGNQSAELTFAVAQLESVCGRIRSGVPE
jgi:histidine phosphotransfer protein HptB